jgi:hypothetical protein
MRQRWRRASRDSTCLSLQTCWGAIHNYSGLHSAGGRGQRSTGSGGGQIQTSTPHMLSDLEHVHLLRSHLCGRTQRALQPGLWRPLGLQLQQQLRP